MPKTLNRRWECPQGAHRAVMAPTRPRKHDIRRFCLPCSQATGYLVERIAPSLEKQRAAQTEARKAKALRKRETAARRKAASWIVTLRADDGTRREAVDVKPIWEACLALPSFRSIRKRSLELVLHRVSESHRKLGHYHGGSNEIHVYVAPSWGRSTLAATILHELAHAKTIPALLQRARKLKHARIDAHGKKFAAALEKATAEYDATLRAHYTGGRTGKRYLHPELPKGTPDHAPTDN